MAVTVKLPTILRKHAGGEAKVSADGATLGEVLADLEAQYPGITKNVIADDGGLHRFINVYVNDEDVRYLGSLETEVADGDTVSHPPRRRRRLLAGSAPTGRLTAPPGIGRLPAWRRSASSNPTRTTSWRPRSPPWTVPPPPPICS